MLEDFIYEGPEDIDFDIVPLGEEAKLLIAQLNQFPKTIQEMLKDNSIVQGFVSGGLDSLFTEMENNIFSSLSPKAQASFLWNLHKDLINPELQRYSEEEMTVYIDSVIDKYRLPKIIMRGEDAEFTANFLNALVSGKNDF